MCVCVCVCACVCKGTAHRKYIVRADHLVNSKKANTVYVCVLIYSIMITSDIPLVLLPNFYEQKDNRPRH